MPVEPRLLGKLAPRFAEVLKDQKAKSVEFELIRAIIGVFPLEVKELQALAVEKLQGFLNSKDPNRKPRFHDSS